MIFKNHVLQALGTIRIRFLQKSNKKCHACVPLKIHKHEIFNLSSILVFPKQRRSTRVSMVVSLTEWDLSSNHLTLTPVPSDLSSVEEVFS
jgi:hypothetical protein